MNLLISIIIGALIGFVVAWIGDALGVPSPIPAIAGFVAFLLVAFYGHNWTSGRRPL